MIGGQVTAPPDGVERNGWAMRFYDQTGTVHIEGVLIDSSNDGITIQAPQATFQIENVLIANNHALRDDFSDAHPDLIQTWSGPKAVRIDRFTGYTDYQGLHLDERGSQLCVSGQRHGDEREHSRAGTAAEHGGQVARRQHPRQARSRCSRLARLDLDDVLLQQLLHRRRGGATRATAASWTTRSAAS